MSVLSRAIPGVNIAVKSTPINATSRHQGYDDRASRHTAREPKCFSMRLVDSGVQISATTSRFARCDRLESGESITRNNPDNHHRHDYLRRQVLERRKAVVQLNHVTTATGKRALVSAGGDNGLVVVEQFAVNYQASNEP